MEIFKITISPLSLYDKKLLTKILDIELHKAFLYFTNKALKTMRWKAGEIILTLNNLIEADTYAKLVDIVENCLVTLFNPKISSLFLDLYLNMEKYENIRDFILSQIMIAPIYSIGKMVPKDILDDIESIAILLNTYACDLLEKPHKDTGISVAQELKSISKMIVYELKDTIIM